MEIFFLKHQQYFVYQKPIKLFVLCRQVFDLKENIVSQHLQFFELQIRHLGNYFFYLGISIGYLHIGRERKSNDVDDQYALVFSAHALLNRKRK